MQQPLAVAIISGLLVQLPAGAAGDAQPLRAFRKGARQSAARDAAVELAGPSTT